MEYLLRCILPLSKEKYDKLENENIDYLLDEEGLVFENKRDRETAKKLIDTQ